MQKIILIIFMWGIYSLVQAGCDSLPVKLNTELVVRFGHLTQASPLLH
jgi:hypothetical protein